MSYYYGFYQPEHHHKPAFELPQGNYHDFCPVSTNSGPREVPPYPVEAQVQPQYSYNRLAFDDTDRHQRSLGIRPSPVHGPQPQLQFAQRASYVHTGPHEPAPKSGLGKSEPTFYRGLGCRPNNVAEPLASNSTRFQPLHDTNVNVLDGLPPLKRRQSRLAYADPTPSLEASKARAVESYLHPQFSPPAKRRNSITGYNRDWSTLQPGLSHILIPLNSVPSLLPLDGVFQEAAMHRAPVIYLPRSSEFSGEYKDPKACINFSVYDMPGPHLTDLVNGRVVIDEYDDEIFKKFRWNITRLQIDWPGLSIPSEWLHALDEYGFPLQRGALATILAKCISKLIIDAQQGYSLPMGKTPELTGSAKYWDIMKVDYNRLRLISVNFYDTVWVPVLAQDVPARIL